MVFMDKLVIRVGGNVSSEARKFISNSASLSSGTHIHIVSSYEEALNLLSSPKKLALLRDLSVLKEGTVSELTRKSKRKQEAISRDVSVLEAQGLIKKTKKGREVFLTPLIDSIEIKLK